MNYSPTASILARHVDSPADRHRLVALDFESLRCLDCCHTLLLKPNRAVLDQTSGQVANASAPAPAASDNRDSFGRLPCYRCGRRVDHTRVDGIDEPIPHTNQEHDPCTARDAGSPAVLPPGGWRALVEAQQ